MGSASMKQLVGSHFHSTEIHHKMFTMFQDQYGSGNFQQGDQKQVFDHLPASMRNKMVELARLALEADALRKKIAERKQQQEIYLRDLGGCADANERQAKTETYFGNLPPMPPCPHNRGGFSVEPQAYGSLYNVPPIELLLVWKQRGETLRRNSEV